MAGSPADTTFGPDRALEARLRDAVVVGVLRAADALTATRTASAAFRGGLRAAELTWTTPGVLDALVALRHEHPDRLVGVGTVVTAAQARDAARAGAQFLVSPHLDAALVRVAFDENVGYLPGVLTPTEVVRALHLGVKLVKVFPSGSVGGPDYLRALRGPFPELQVLATGGIHPRDVPAYRHAGAVAAGLGSHLFPAPAVARGAWHEVERATRDAVAEAQRS